MFSMSIVFVGCEYEGQPTQTTSNLETQSLSKKPIKPELIKFTGDLSGQQEVLGCCPNAGPFPEYTMTLSETFGELSGTYDGNIFMNKVGRKPNQSYMVQFWWTESANNYYIEIRGGAFEEDKKNKTIIATFTEESCEIWINNALTLTEDVSFVLTRAPAQ
jgi:hypothetical protein